MHVLITGGAGFIGSYFVQMIVQGRFPGISKVTVLDKLTYSSNIENLSDAKTMNGFQFIQGDICDYKLVRTLMEDVDALINFAAESHVDKSIIEVESFVQTNIVGVQILLDACKATNREIRFVQISTDEVYGSIQLGASNEKWPILPNSPYAASKAGGELLVRSYFVTHGIDTVVTRCSNNYGPFQFPEKLIPLFITNLIQGKKLPVYGNGTNIRDWLHVEDHCRGVYMVLMKGRSGEVYNIGGGQELSNLQIAHFILNAFGEDETSIEFVQDRKGHDFRYSVDWSKIKNELGYLPQINFDQGFSDTIDWYRKNQSWWR